MRNREDEEGEEGEEKGVGGMVADFGYWQPYMMATTAWGQYNKSPLSIMKQSGQGGEKIHQACKSGFIYFGSVVMVS